MKLYISSVFTPTFPIENLYTALRNGPSQLYVGVKRSLSQRYLLTKSHLP
jgi:hypothetical protein